MTVLRIRWLLLGCLAALLAFGWMGPPEADSACCYFTAKDKDILQPAQKVFITWEPTEKVETFTVQPRFEGLDGGFHFGVTARACFGESRSVEPIGKGVVVAGVGVHHGMIRNEAERP